MPTPFPTAPAPTEALTRFIQASRDEDFPAEARRRARDAIVDCLGCLLAGSREPLARPLLAVVPTAAPGTLPGGVPLGGTDREAAPADAALLNGTFAHALDYDDTNHPAYAHPSAVIVPVLLALGGGATGRDWITAYILGLEVFGKLGRALNFAHYKTGWHATGTFGALAAVAVAGRLLRLDPAALRRALGIAATMAGGLRANFGTMGKPLHAGVAARNGVFAALLAREGFTASEAILEHEHGYARVFNHDQGIDPAPLQSWGAPLEILTDYGLALKPYPSGGATHPAIEAALQAREELCAGGGAFPAASVRSVRVGVAERAFDELALGIVVPRSPLEAKFSMPFCIAAALVDGAVTLDTFDATPLVSPAVGTLIERVGMAVDDRVRHDTEFATYVTVATADGRAVERLVPLAMGKPARWFSEERLRAKFMECGGRTLPADRLEALFAHLLALDRPVPPRAVIEGLRLGEHR